MWFGDQFFRVSFFSVLLLLAVVFPVFGGDDGASGVVAGGGVSGEGHNNTFTFDSDGHSSFNFTSPATGACMVPPQQFIPPVGPCARKKLLFVSFPKSGRTWLRCLISTMYMVQTKGQGVLNISLGALDQSINHLPLSFTHGRDHPYSMTPQEMQHMPPKSFFQDSPILYLARDPRDVAVSNYHDVRTRGFHTFFNPPYRAKVRKMDFSEFLRLPVGSYITNVAMLNVWGEFQGGRCPRNTLYYENLMSDGCWEREYEKLAILLKLQLSQNQLALVRDRCNFNKLKHETETSASPLHKRWKIVIPGNPNSAKVRKGRVGGFVDEVSLEDIAYMQENAKFIEAFHEYANEPIL